MGAMDYTVYQKTGVLEIASSHSTWRLAADKAREIVQEGGDVVIQRGGGERLALAAFLRSVGENDA